MGRFTNSNNATVTTGQFVNVSTDDYHLATPTAAGYPLASPYNYDRDGKMRGSDGTWDMGAYESGVTYHVRAGAPGGDGLSWTTAFNSLSSVPAGNHTAYIAAGTYSKTILSKSGVSDAQRLIYKRATVGEHGSDTGWSASYDGQVWIDSTATSPGDSGVLQFSGSYITLDGVTRYGIYITGGNNSSPPTQLVTINGTYNTLRYAWIDGTYRGDAACQDGVQLSTNSTLEYSKITGFRSGSLHGDAITSCYTCTLSNCIIRYNFVQAGLQYISTSGINSIQIYGNVTHNNGENHTHAIQMENYGTGGTSVMYNNIFNGNAAGWPYSGQAGLFVGSGSTSGWTIKNNYFKNYASFGGSRSYNAYDSCDGAPSSETGAVITTTPGFTSWSTGDYTLLPTSVLIGKGSNLGSPYNSTYDGKTRPATGAWSIGAYEYGEDITPPVVLNLLPSGVQTCSSDPRSITLSVETNEPANCSWATTDVAYASMTPFSTPAGYTHSSTITGFACGASYTRYVRCRDTSPALNTNLTSSTISFSIAAASPDDITPPVMSNPLPATGSSLACTTNPRNVTLGITAVDEVGATDTTCKYNTTDVAYASMSGTYDTKDAGNNQTKVVSLACGASYTYYSRCSDNIPNVNTSSSSTTFSITSAQPVESGIYEAELGALVVPIATTADVNAHGGYYISTITEENGTATFTVVVTETATYRIIGRIYNADSGSDSIYLAIDGGTEFIWDMNPTATSADFNVWRYDAVTNRGTGTYNAPQYDPYQISLDAGNHTFVFRGREVDARLDYFYLEKADIPPPTGFMILGAGGTLNMGTGTTTTMYIQ